jgi:hypothetical protein
MITKWESTKESIDKYLYLLAKQIILGNFQNKGILLFHQKQKNCKIPYIVFPRLNKQLHLDLLEENNKKELEKILPDKMELIDLESISEKIAQWKSIESNFIHDIIDFFPELPYEQIVIVPTSYGLRGWYYLEEDTLYIYHRIDFPVKYIAISILNQIIISKYIKKQSKDSSRIYQDELWIAKQAIMTFLMTTTKFQSYIPEYKNISAQVKEPELNTEMKDLSNRNYAQLGFPSRKLISLQDNNLFYDDQPVRILTTTQENLLKEFVAHRDKVLTIDQISRIMWGEDHVEKFSLTAISKMIHELRQQLKRLGLQKEVIFTKRKEGYIFIE